jgi:replicative DNA helicase
MLVSVEAEQGVLGALLLNNDLLPSVTGLEARHFAEPLHGQIFDAIKLRVESGRPATPITLRADFEDALSDLGGGAYLVRMCGAAIPSGLAGYASHIRELWGRRMVQEAAERAAAAAASPQGADIARVAADLETAVADALTGAATKPLSRSVGASVIDAVREMGDAYQAGAPVGARSMLAPLDDVIGAFRPGRLYVLAGRPSMGKTALALVMAANVAQQGSPVAFVSLEMPDVDLTRRLVSQELRRDGVSLPHKLIEQGSVSEDQFRQVAMKAREVGSLPIRFISADYRDLDRLSLAIKHAHRAHGIGMVVVDYMQLVQVAQARSTFDRVSAVSKAMKGMAMRLQVPVLALSQLSREVEARDVPRPKLSDLRASGEIEEDADTVILVYREEYYLERKALPVKDADRSAHFTALADSRNIVECIVAKNRAGPVATARLKCDLACNWIEAAPDVKQPALDLVGAFGV